VARRRDDDLHALSRRGVAVGVALLTSRGVRIYDGIHEQPCGRFVTFDDPDGNGVLQATSPTA